MKVLQINSVCGIHSTGRICTDIADVLTANNHECKIAYGRETIFKEHKKYAVRIGNNFDVKLHAAVSRIFDSSGFGSKLATKKFIKWVKEYNPDIIHIHNIHGYYINIEILFRYLAEANKPVIWTLHDCWPFTGHCAHFTAAECYKWKNGCFDCPQKNKYPSSYILDRSKFNWRRKKELFTSISKLTLITPSNWLAELVKESFLDKYQVKVLPNGIDLEAFKPTSSDFRHKYELEDKKIILGVASAWSEHKGLHDFIELSKIVDKSFKIVLVGLTQEQIKHLPKDILGIGKINSTRELAEIYTSADVFVNPSIEETMGLTSIEAIACGTQAIVYNSTALPEFINDKSGVVVNCNPRSIYSALYVAYSHDTSCSIQARLYEKNIQYLKLLDLYRSMA